MTLRSVPAEIERERFDLIVIGAGINGLAIARDAATRGCSVLVLDKGDIASGTTSWSTRLIHGGLRYLEHYEFALVRESLRERERLLGNAPHLVKPCPLLLPIYEGAKRGPALIRAGMVLYDALSWDKSLPRHRMFSASETRNRAPSLDPDGLRGGALYYDAQASYAERLAVEQAISAREHGAVVLTYCRVDRILATGAVVDGVEATDLLSGDRFRARGRTVVNVAGPWIDAVLAGAPPGAENARYIGGTKGSHLVVAPFPGAPRDALYYEAKQDRRAVFVVPWLGMFLIGSTDIRYTGDLDDVRADESEIAYLLGETNALLPGAKLTRDDILYTYCGVRPLPYQAAGSEGAISRSHVIHTHAPSLRGLWSIIGGKLTTHRSLAEEMVDRLMPELGKTAPCRTARLPLPGAAGIEVEAFRAGLIAVSGLPEATTSRLVDVYGRRAEHVLALARTDARLAEPFDQETGAIAAEVVFAVRDEHAVHLTDVLLRRTMVGLAPHAGIGPDEAAADVAVEHLGWDVARAGDEVAAYRAFVERFHPHSLIGTPRRMLV